MTNLIYMGDWEQQNPPPKASDYYYLFIFDRVSYESAYSVWSKDYNTEFYQRYSVFMDRFVEKLSKRIFESMSTQFLKKCPNPDDIVVDVTNNGNLITSTVTFTQDMQKYYLTSSMSEIQLGTYARDLTSEPRG